MAFEDLRAAIDVLMDEIVRQPEDRHELQERLRETLAEYRALGLPLPDDLAALEAELEKELPPDRILRPTKR